MRSLDRFLYRLPLIIFALCAFGVAHAQSAPWDQNSMGWTAPTACTSGQPIANCPVTGYRVERSATATGAYAAVGTTTAAVTQFTHTSVAAGSNCYRVVALSAKGDSAPSAPPPLCFTNTPPSGPPNPPTNLTVIAPTAYEVRPNESTFAFDRGRSVGTVKLGAACDEERTTGEGFYALERPSRVTLTRQPRSVALVAKCGGV